MDLDLLAKFAGFLPLSLVAWWMWRNRESDAFMRETDKWKEERDREMDKQFEQDYSELLSRSTMLGARGISDSSYFALTQARAQQQAQWTHTRLPPGISARTAIEFLQGETMLVRGKSSMKARKCTGCGATAKGKCEYCGGEAI